MDVISYPYSKVNDGLQYMLAKEALESKTLHFYTWLISFWDTLIVAW